VWKQATANGPQVDADTTEIALGPGDRLMLCTDGLFKAVAADQLVSHLASPHEPQGVADQLVSAATGNGADDNVTVVIIDLR
jgi:PPM family protein phosphatase